MFDTFCELLIEMDGAPSAEMTVAVVSTTSVDALLAAVPAAVVEVAVMEALQAAELSCGEVSLVAARWVGPATLSAVALVFDSMVDAAVSAEEAEFPVTAAAAGEPFPVDGGGFAAATIISPHRRRLSLRYASRAALVFAAVAGGGIARDFFSSSKGTMLIGR